MVDGYANGWLVDPSSFGPDFRVSLHWTPQKVVWIAIALSAVTLVALVIAALWLWQLDRRAGVGWLRTPAADGPALDPPMPWRAEPRVRGAGVALACGVFAFVFGGLVVGLAVALLVGLSKLVPRARLVLRIVPWASYALIAAWYVLKQYRNAYPVGVEWPNAFDAMHPVALVAMLTLVADTVLRRSPTTHGAAHDQQSESDGRTDDRTA
jgi:arabinofuranan 3-O-arabinosyltransferase